MATQRSIQNMIESLYDRCAIMVREASMGRLASTPDQTIKECRSAVTTLLSAIYSTPSDTIPNHSWNTSEAVVARRFLNEYVPWDSIDESFRVVMLDILGSKDSTKNIQMRFEAILYHHTNRGLSIGAQNIYETSKKIAETVGATGSIPIIKTLLHDGFEWVLPPPSETLTKIMDMVRGVVKGMSKGVLDDGLFMEIVRTLLGAQSSSSQERPALGLAIMNMLILELFLAHRGSLIPTVTLAYGCDIKTSPYRLTMIKNMMEFITDNSQTIDVPLMVSEMRDVFAMPDNEVLSTIPKMLSLLKTEEIKALVERIVVPIIMPTTIEFQRGWLCLLARYMYMFGEEMAAAACCLCPKIRENAAIECFSAVCGTLGRCGLPDDERDLIWIKAMAEVLHITPSIAKYDNFLLFRMAKEGGNECIKHWLQTTLV
jgi:hypothetical protein